MPTLSIEFLAARKYFLDATLDLGACATGCFPESTAVHSRPHEIFFCAVFVRGQIADARQLAGRFLRRRAGGDVAGRGGSVVVPLFVRVRVSLAGGERRSALFDAQPDGRSYRSARRRGVSMNASPDRFATACNGCQNSGHRTQVNPVDVQQFITINSHVPQSPHGSYLVHTHEVIGSSPIAPTTSVPSLKNFDDSS